MSGEVGGSSDGKGSKDYMPQRREKIMYKKDFETGRAISRQIRREENVRYLQTMKCFRLSRGPGDRFRVLLDKLEMAESKNKGKKCQNPSASC